MLGPAGLAPVSDLHCRVVFEMLLRGALNMAAGKGKGTKGGESGAH